MDLFKINVRVLVYSKKQSKELWLLSLEEKFWEHKINCLLTPRGHKTTLHTYVLVKITFHIGFPVTLRSQGREEKMPITRSQTKIEKEKKKLLEEENKERVAKSKELQKNIVVEDPVKAEKWRHACKEALSVCLTDPANYYKCPSDPIFEFFRLNEEIQLTGKPWLLSKEGYSPSSFTYELLDRHFECLRTWRKWRGCVPCLE